MPDGTPQVTPVWIDYRDGLIWVNTAEGRVKERNARRDPRVGVSVIDRTNDYTWVSVRGRVVEMTKDGAEDHIDFLNKKYRDEDIYPLHSPEQPRVIIKIRPDRVAG
jgi:PPOX class probable F420-dependent enzyme